MASLGGSWQEWPGIVRHSLLRSIVVRQARIGVARSVKVSRGTARQVRCVRVCRGFSRIGTAGGSGSVVESRDAEGQGTAGSSRYGEFCPGKSGIGRQGGVCNGLLRQGGARNGRQGLFGRCAEWRGLDRLDLAGYKPKEVSS